MNTGHEGSLSTCHANSPADALRRLETMVLMGDVDLPLLAVRTQLESALDLVVQVARGPGGARRVVEVAEVVDHGGGEAAARADGRRTRTLAHATAVVALPTRAPRAAGAAPADPTLLRADLP
jgi:Flp pilus assembly CpaF family ATPase